jgi:hypothetical protein
MCGPELREVGVARVRQLTARLLKIKLSVVEMIPRYRQPGAAMTVKEMEAARRTALREKLHALNSAQTTDPRPSVGGKRPPRRCEHQESAEGQLDALSAGVLAE